MAARLSAFIVWAALAASAVFWGLRLAGGSPAAPPHTVPVGDTMVPRADLNRLFGAPPVAEAAQEAPPPEQSRFKLIGLAAPREAGGPGVAVIAVESKPPRAYRVGATVDGDLVLQSVERRSVALGPRGAGATVRLELPVLPAAATGALAPPMADGGAAPVSLPPPQAGGLPPETRGRARGAPVPPATLPPEQQQPVNVPEQQAPPPQQDTAARPPNLGGPVQTE